MEAWYDRFIAMERVCGPSSWATLTASHKDIHDAQALVKQAAVGGSSIDAGALARARALVSATTHPDTGSIIPLPFRMCAHVPVNTLLLVGMLTAATPATTGVWQFLNQSFNAAQFYANRNASNPVSDAQLAASYGGAVAASVGVGVGLKRFFDAALRTAEAARNERRVRLARVGVLAVPFLAASAAKPLQIGLMRSDEWRHGVNVYDESGAQRGRSVEAGRAAVAMTIAVRTIYLVPMLYLPWLQRAVLAAVPVIAKRAWAANATFVALTALSSAYVTPACMAIFNQWSSMPVEQLEPEFHHLSDAGGNAVDYSRLVVKRISWRIRRVGRSA